MVSICNANLVINSPTQDTTQDQLYAIHSCKMFLRLQITKVLVGVTEGEIKGTLFNWLN